MMMSMIWPLRLAADALQTSPRTLQRRLFRRGLSYKQVVAVTRFRLARQLLDDPRQRVIDVALELGYAEPSNFIRAFRRWAGLTPGVFRRHMRARGIPRLDGRGSKRGTT
jgi:AraC-like DNA-binding protein